MFQVLEIAEIKVGKKTNNCLNFSLVFRIIWILINISVVIIQRMQEENKSLGMLKNGQFGQEILTLSPVACITVHFKTLVSNLFHTGSALVESKSIKRKTRLS